ncbi:hypothetical protein M5689_008683 [Euphorbia peplus]|nr:hypothetical protein M5689_008683 [Euphorbia peplus]
MLVLLCILLVVPVQSQVDCNNVPFKELCEGTLKSSPAKDKKTLVRHSLNLTMSTVNEIEKILSTFKPPEDPSGFNLCTKITKNAKDTLQKLMNALESGGYEEIKSGLDTIDSDSNACDYTMSITSDNPIEGQDATLVAYCRNTNAIIDQLKD